VTTSARITPAALVRVPAGTTAGAAVREAGLATKGPDTVVVVRDDEGNLRDLSWAPETDVEVEAVTAGSEDGRSVIRHSAAHVLAQAVQQEFPEAKLGIGPPIKDGFYYDFQVERPFTPEDLAKLESRMKKIIKGAQRFEGRARVVYSRPAKGMGLMFASIEPQQFRTLEAWLAESRETSWLAANRRRSQRVLMAVPVRVSGKTGAGAFEEETQTRAISAHGALIHLLTQVYRGQRLTLSNVQTKAALECLVAHIDRRQPNQPQVGVEFLLPNPLFWHVAFPPKDWTPRHPDAKSRTESRESS